MNPSEIPEFRADEVWRRFVGMFGGDVVERKYGVKPPPEWISLLGKLSDFQIDRGLRRLAYSGKEIVPSLPFFARLCRTVQDDGIEEGPRTLALPNPDRFDGDKWTVAGNLRLMAYIMRKLQKAPRSMGPIVYGQGSKGSPEQQRATEILVQFKIAWVRDMREWDVHPQTGELLEATLEQQNENWNGCMERAEEAIAEQEQMAA